MAFYLPVLLGGQFLFFEEVFLSVHKNYPGISLATVYRTLDLLTSYSNQEELIRKLDPGKQYLISGKHEGKKIRIGNFNSYLSEAKLPVRSKREPRPLT